MAAIQKTAVILNPNSGNRRALRQWDRLKIRIDELLGEFTTFETNQPGHATELCRKALNDGYTRIISAGGDGTHYEVVNGFFKDDTPLNPEASIAVLPVGTACDLRKTLDLPKPAASIKYLADPNPSTIDVGKLTSTNPDGSTSTHYFLTAVHIGLGSLTANIVNDSSKRLGGFATFLLGVLQARLKYRCPELKICYNDQIVTKSTLEVYAANGKFDGGGMNIAPKATLNDGLLDLYIIGNMGIAATLQNLPRIYKGTQDQHPDVDYAQTKKIEITSKESIWVSPDGEIAGQLPATIEILPNALKIVTGPNPPLIRP